MYDGLQASQCHNSINYMCIFPTKKEFKYENRGHIKSDIFIHSRCAENKCHGTIIQYLHLMVFYDFVFRLQNDVKNRRMVSQIFMQFACHTGDFIVQLYRCQLCLESVVAIFQTNFTTPLKTLYTTGWSYVG